MENVYRSPVFQTGEDLDKALTAALMAHNAAARAETAADRAENAASAAFSPTVEVTSIDGGHRLKITDVNGEKNVDVMDGANGKTPVKGTDYFTTADKTEMVNLVLDALPTWTGGSY